MKSHPIQFGVRENTASPRQHASRLAVRSLPNAICSEQESPATLDSSLQSELGANGFDALPHAAPPHAATGEERQGQNRLLTLREVAELLRVPVSWVYDHTRPQSNHPLPHLKLGKYLRFRADDIADYLNKTGPTSRISR